MKKLLEYLVTSLVDHPEGVRIEEKQAGEETLYEVCVLKSDLGKVIGKKGRTAKAMRVLVSSIAAFQNKNVNFEIVEPPEEQKPELAKTEEAVAT